MTDNKPSLMKPAVALAAVFALYGAWNSVEVIEPHGTVSVHIGEPHKLNEQAPAFAQPSLKT